MRDKMRKLLDAISKHAKIVFPILIIVLVAATVLISLKLSDLNKERLSQLEQLNADSTSETESETEEEEAFVSLSMNEDPAINTLIRTYYNAIAEGDEETIASVTENMEQIEIYINREKAKYIKEFPLLDVYIKPGYDEKSYMAFVYSITVFENVDVIDGVEFYGYRAYMIHTREDGTLYIEMGSLSDEEYEYTLKVLAQEDVIDFHNRVTVEHNEMLEAEPTYLDALNALTATMERDAGIALAADLAIQEAEANPEEEEPEEEETEEVAPEEPEEIILYVTTTAAVNVRSSDSEKADKLGKASKGMKLQVVEQRVNGWTKVIFEGKEGFIKSEYLKLQDTTANLTAIGTVEATTTVNVRAQASETATKLGALPKGTVVNLYANENGWCKIEFNGQIGYVKGDYVK